MTENHRPSAASGPRLARRPLIMGATAVLAAGAVAPALTSAGAKAQTGTPTGASMRERVSRFLSLLAPDQRSRALFAFDSSQRFAWNFMLGSRQAPGLPLEEMLPEQKDAALDVLSTGLSEQGFVKAERIMLQQDILRDEWGKGSPDRNRERFSLQVYGEPAAGAAWGWRWEGHHLSLTYTLIGDEVVSATPSSFSSEPNPVPSGPYAGLVVLEEAQIGQQIYADMATPQRATALINETSFGNILTTAGNEEGLGSVRQGVPLADLPAGQAERLVELVHLFTTDNLPSDLAEAERARINAGDLMSAHFAWAGGTLENSPSIYYRLHGDHFLIEFATLRNQPMHHHAVRHDLAHNFGRHRV